MSTSAAALLERPTEPGGWIQVHPIPKVPRRLKLLERPADGRVCVEDFPKISARPYSGELDVL
jgi:hypothetical protein